MPKHFANLDALIIREDFEIEGDPNEQSKSGGNLKLSELEKQGIVFQMLRKPDFQRETANWTPEKVCELIRSFVDGDLIPSIIMWRSPKSGNVFVIDGAHRLSALIAWLHDDYGDREISTAFFGKSIPPEQEAAASETRELVKRHVGTYAQFKFIAQTPGQGSPVDIRRAKNAGVLPIELQWVTGDASKAEASFFTINQSATAIDETELRIIKARNKPNAVAARALIRAGLGHKYWSAFAEDKRHEIEKMAREIYNILFDPALETPIKTLDLPVAGSGYSITALRLIFDFINSANGFRPEMWLPDETAKSGKPAKRKKAKAPAKPLPDDPTGDATIECLRVIKRVATRISGNSPRSLGFHPAVYFYGSTGRYQSTSFLATVALVRKLEETDSFAAFTDIRARFEDFLIKYGQFKSQITHSWGIGKKSVEALTILFDTIYTSMLNHETDSAIVSKLLGDKRLKCLKLEEDDDLEQSPQSFTSQTKSAAFLRSAIEGAVRCKICGARVHKKGISVDHDVRKEDGGRGDLANAKITHPYCNTGYKESQHAKSKKAANAPA